MVLLHSGEDPLRLTGIGVTGEWWDTPDMLLQGYCLERVTRRPPVARVHTCVCLMSSNEGQNTAGC